MILPKPIQDHDVVIRQVRPEPREQRGMKIPGTTAFAQRVNFEIIRSQIIRAGIVQANNFRFVAPGDERRHKIADGLADPALVRVHAADEVQELHATKPVGR